MRGGLRGCILDVNRALCTRLALLEGASLFGLGVQGIMLMLLLALFFYGGEKIPEIAKGLGKGLRACKRALDQGDDDAQEKERPMKGVSKRSTNGQVT